MYQYTTFSRPKIGLIYGIFRRPTDPNDLSPTGELLYVGSTTIPLNLRWNEHHAKSKTSNTKLYTTIRSIGARNCVIVELDRIPDLTERKILLERERDFILKLSPSCNTNTPLGAIKNEPVSRLNKVKKAISALISSDDLDEKQLGFDLISQLEKSLKIS